DLPRRPTSAPSDHRRRARDGPRRRTRRRGRHLTNGEETYVGELMGIARFRFNDGKREEYERLAAEASELVRANEPGTLQYDVFYNDDRTECLVIERYRDSDAAM